MQCKSYKELECYIKARELSIFISAPIKKIPTHKKLLLKAQIIDCFRSIIRNIAAEYEDILLQTHEISLSWPAVL